MNGVFEEAKMDPSITQKECWEHLEFCGKLVSSVGFLQTYALQGPQGEEIRSLTNELLIHAVKETSFDEAEKVSDAFLDSFAPQAMELSNLYRKYLTGQLSLLAMYLQHLPMNELFVQAVTDLKAESLDKMGLSEAEAEAIKAKLKDAGFGGSDKTLVAMKPCDALLPIIDAGVYAAGGEANFAVIQSKVMSTMPSNLADKQGNAICASLIASVVTAIAKRATGPQLGAVMVQGAIEAVIAAKRVLAMPYIAAYGSRPSDIFETLLGQAAEKVAMLDSPEAAEASKKQSAAAEQVFNREAKATSTVFGGNGTKN